MNSPFTPRTPLILTLVLMTGCGGCTDQFTIKAPDVSAGLSSLSEGIKKFDPVAEQAKMQERQKLQEQVSTLQAQISALTRSTGPGKILLGRDIVELHLDKTVGSPRLEVKREAAGGAPETTIVNSVVGAEAKQPAWALTEGLSQAASYPLNLKLLNPDGAAVNLSVWVNRPGFSPQQIYSVTLDKQTPSAKTTLELTPYVGGAVEPNGRDVDVVLALNVVNPDHIFWILPSTLNGKSLASLLTDGYRVVGVSNHPGQGNQATHIIVALRRP